ncbi:hypothetical protein DPEC_G00186200, partial [Dallia pectoralis]
MMKKLFYCISILGVFFFSLYFWYHLSFSNVTEFINDTNRSLIYETNNQTEKQTSSGIVNLHPHTNSDLWKSKTSEKNNVTNIPKDTRKSEELEKCPDSSPLLVGPLRIEFSTA